MKMNVLAALFALFMFSPAGLAAATSEEAVVLDVRTPEEFGDSHLKGATNIDFRGKDFDAQVAKLDKSKSYKLYCRSGNRSGQAIEKMKKMGFERLENLGGLHDAAGKLKAACEGKKPC